MRIHIISVGGRIMHTLAILLKKQGHQVTGSDDEIYEPSKSKLSDHDLLPVKMGWSKESISSEIDFVILGMHARADNPELKEAQRLGIEILSYPEFIYQQSKNKKRIVVAGSHGKTTTTAMIMHVLKYRDIDFDYLVGAELDGFDSMVKLSDAPLIIIEGDEYLSSCIDRQPKMYHYHPHLSVITGVAWDHINVFKTEQDYVDLFNKFGQRHEDESVTFVYHEDEYASRIAKNFGSNHRVKFYNALEKLDNGNIKFENKQYRVNVFGKHNRSNMMAALKICIELGITAPDFFAAISNFKGASRRMELLLEKEGVSVYRDFAHAPSKVKASLNAVREHFPDRKLIAFIELHTYSSLSAAFLPKYKDSLMAADEAVVYYSPHTLEIKKMPSLSEKVVLESFGKGRISVISDKDKLVEKIEQIELENCVVVLMSSGNFDKIDVKEILISK